MSRRLPATVLTLASALVIVALGAAALSGLGPRAQAHADPLADLASTGGMVADLIEAGGSGPSTAQIMALGTAAMAVVSDAPNHPECTTMGSLGESAVEVYEWLHQEYVSSGGAATAATYADHLTALQAIVTEASDLFDSKQTSAPTPEATTPPPASTPTPTPQPPTDAPTATPPPTDTPAGGSGSGSGSGTGGGAPGAADTGSGGISSSSAGLGLLALGLLAGSTIVAAGRIATRRTRS